MDHIKSLSYGPYGMAIEITVNHKNYDLYDRLNEILTNLSDKNAVNVCWVSVQELDPETINGFYIFMFNTESSRRIKLNPMNHLSLRIMLNRHDLET